MGPLKIAEAGELVVESPKHKLWVGISDPVTACLQALGREDFRKGINMFLPQPSGCLSQALKSNEVPERKKSIPPYCKGMENSVKFLYFST